MKITNVKVYDLEESIVASGLPMMAEYDADDFDESCTFLEIARCDEYDTIHGNPHFKRACKLAANQAGSGHNNFLSGIVVSMNVTATNVWWMQLERYHFVQIVSSQSKMHRLRQMIRDGKGFPFHKKTDIDSAGVLVYAVGEDKDDETLVYSCPMGLELTARITTNYLQLKTIYGQRHNHKLAEWRDFCEEIKILPFANELILKK
jgi:hypothetical protein